MIILDINGGIGNQMFQYAMYCVLKQTVDVKANIINGNPGTRPYKLDIFTGVDVEQCTNSEYNKIAYRGLGRYISNLLIRIGFLQSTKYQEDEDNAFDNQLLELDNVILSGYFQSFSYVNLVEDELRRAFVFNAIEKKLEKFCDAIPYNSASIHIRRGDYLNFSSIYGGICTEKYYEKALIKCKTLGINNFVVVSDDIDWVKKHVSIPNAIYVEKELFDEYEDWYDLYIMSKCDHNILANSTFSWWGTWLNENPNKIVISPSRFENLHPDKNLISDEWIVIN